jgi:peptidoglycan-associated lipoprotein
MKGTKMQKKIRSWIPLAVLILALVFSTACSKKVISRTDDTSGSSTQYSQNTDNRSLDQQDSAISENIAESGSGMSSDDTMMIHLEDIYFEFDRATLTAKSQKILTKKATWLKSNNDVKVVIEGHCDNRGTNEYNLALGDRRAAATKAFLADMGISPSRMTTISYGEERPLLNAQNEEAWAKNRRAHFEVE